MAFIAWDPGYLEISTACWWALFCITALQGFIKRKARGRGWQVHWAVRATIIVESISTTLKLGVASAGEDAMDSSLMKGYIFFSNSAEAVFLVLLLLIASGFCITSNSLGERKWKVMLIPFVYWVVSLIIDYVWLHRKSSLPDYGPNEKAVEGSSGLDVFALVPVKMVVLILSWICVFDIVSQEIRSLEGVEESIDGDEGGDSAQPGYTRAAAETGADSDPDGLLSPRNMGSHVPESDPEAGLPNSTQDESTVFDTVQKKRKLKLLKNFFNATALYAAFAVVVNLFPVFAYKKTVVKVENTMFVLQDLILFLFVCSLAWIFRPRNDSPYLLLMEELMADDEAPTTELGVISTGEPSEVVHRTGALARPNQVKQGIDGNFTLEDDEDNIDPQPSNKDGSPKKGPKVQGPKKAA